MVQYVQYHIYIYISYINGLETGLTWAANGSEPQYIVMTLLPQQPVQHVFNVKDGKYCKQCHFDHLCGYVSSMFEHWLPNNMIERTQKEQPKNNHNKNKIKQEQDQRQRITQKYTEHQHDYGQIMSTRPASVQSDAPVGSASVHAIWRRGSYRSSGKRSGYGGIRSQNRLGMEHASAKGSTAKMTKLFQDFKGSTAPSQHLDLGFIDFKSSCELFFPSSARFSGQKIIKVLV